MVILLGNTKVGIEAPGGTAVDEGDNEDNEDEDDIQLTLEMS
jgi:hypothetical protein